ncbi:MAG: dipeptide/oligopeptide/nickel ABC transporter ATP-binding protein [Sporomusaceae bacterium]|jgi:ABC-type glutathione transport system ATPase component|nr:dipeptide/oligopeptide/nickel ABC transporter ATP-binding protein [Sporomusaceae bacterium]
MQILKVEEAAKYYRLHKSLLAGHDIVKAVDDVSLEIETGESFGIVGESGSGKSTLASLIAHLEPLSAGKIYFDGENLAAVSKTRRRELRRNLQIVFQDAYASLDPRFSVWETLAEPIANFSLVKEKGVKPIKIITELLERVELSPTMLKRYPNELSGGERQRVCIARALSLAPKFIIFDEATSGLDVTLQSQILKLLKTLQTELKLTYLFITHNLQLIPALTDRVAVMRQGKIVETLGSRNLKDAVHPYTKELLAAIPASHPRLRKTVHTPAES